MYLASLLLFIDGKVCGEVTPCPLIVVMLYVYITNV